MPLYSVDARSGQAKHKFERSPKISIVTDAVDIHAIPREIRGIVPDERRIIRDLSEWQKSDTDACVVWHSGDRFIEGNAIGFLKALHSPNRRSFVLVNTPCAEEIPFVTVQPRIFVRPASIDRCSFQFRIENDALKSSGDESDSNRRVESWASLVEAVSQEKGKAGAGIPLLISLWESRHELPDFIGALSLRNLVAAMIRLDEFSNARKFLEAGGKLYPTYGEAHYLAALLAFREQRFQDSYAHLGRAKSCGRTLPGMGGENSYRCDWLLGMLAARLGSDRAAFQHFLTGIRRHLVFEPSIVELVKLRLPRSLIEVHQHEFTRIARTNPHLRKTILEYLSANGFSGVARRITESFFVEAERNGSTQSHHMSSAPPPLAVASNNADPIQGGDCSGQKLGIVLEGPIFEHSSFARVNREIARVLSSADYEVRLEASTPGKHPADLFPNGETLTQFFRRQLHRTDLTIRHQWPPDFRRPPTGKLAVILPWEYGGVPRVWIEEIQRSVDELWVPSRFVRGVFVQNGVDPERVVVIPNGYDPKLFHPEGSRLRPQGSRGFIFLFVGGAIQRKGVDLLLDAYKAAFDASENVTLVLLASGSTAAYQHNSLISEIRRTMDDVMSPPILPFFESIDDTTLADLYRGADVLVLPYRGEGFGMPLIEAMACGKPVITTAQGPSKDFCDESNSYLVPARTEFVLDKPPPLGPMRGSFTWFEPSFLELVRTLRHAWEHPEEVAAKGRSAAKSAARFTWRNVADQYAARIRKLCEL